MAVFLLPMSAYADSSSPEESLTSSQIKEYYEFILNKYQVNEPFSPEDAQFIEKYANAVGAFVVSENQNVVSPRGVDRSSFTGQSGGLALTGYVSYDHNVLGKNTWEFYMNAWDVSGIKRNIVDTISFDCFGVIDVQTGAVGKIHSDTVSTSSSGKVAYLELNKTASYTGLPIMVYYYPKASFDGVEVRGEFR
jgi:hypothetical protein